MDMERLKQMREANQRKRDKQKTDIDSLKPEQKEFVHREIRRLEKEKKQNQNCVKRGEDPPNKKPPRGYISNMIAHFKQSNLGDEVDDDKEDDFSWEDVEDSNEDDVGDVSTTKDDVAHLDKSGGEDAGMSGHMKLPLAEEGNDKQAEGPVLVTKEKSPPPYSIKRVNFENDEGEEEGDDEGEEGNDNEQAEVPVLVTKENFVLNTPAPQVVSTKDSPDSLDSEQLADMPEGEKMEYQTARKMAIEHGREELKQGEQRQQMLENVLAYKQKKNEKSSKLLDIMEQEQKRQAASDAEDSVIIQSILNEGAESKKSRQAQTERINRYKKATTASHRKRISTTGRGASNNLLKAAFHKGGDIAAASPPQHDSPVASAFLNKENNGATVAVPTSSSAMNLANATVTEFTATAAHTTSTEVVAVTAGGTNTEVVAVAAATVGATTSADFVVKPVFAMAKRSEEEGNCHDWAFKLETHLMAIKAQVPGRDLYLVGYRDEERPNLFDANKRTSVPFFAVHALDKGRPAPQTIMLYDGEAKTEEEQSLNVAPFQWVLNHTFPSGETVSMLQFKGRKTKRASQTQSTITVGGQVFFPIEFNSSKENPGDGDDNAFIMIEGEEFFFDSEVWGWAKPKLRNDINESPFENWVDVCCRAKRAEFLAIAMPAALHGFFHVYDDLDRSVHEEQVMKYLSTMFLRFKKKVIDHQKRNHRAAAAEGAVHFKIYPDNPELHRYLEKGDNKYISMYCGKATDVFPKVGGGVGAVGDDET